jgi:hypothetical protein
MLLAIDSVMLSIACDDHVEIAGDTPDIMHPEPLLQLFLDRPNQTLVINDKEIINLHNDCANDYALCRIVEHKQSSVDT